MLARKYFYCVQLLSEKIVFSNRRTVSTSPITSPSLSQLHKNTQNYTKVTPPDSFMLLVGLTCFVYIFGELEKNGVFLLKSTLTSIKITFHSAFLFIEYKNGVRVFFSVCKGEYTINAVLFLTGCV